MLLTVSDEYAVVLALDSLEQIHCDFSLSQAVTDQFLEDSSALYAWIQPKMPGVWQHLLQEIPENPWIQASQLSGKSVRFSLLLVTNAEIQTLNREFRDKDAATDVLTFSLLEEAMDQSVLIQLPELHLGEIYVSLEWAKQETCKEIEADLSKSLHFSEKMTLLILERIIHGCLHLLGVHHDTMSDYNKVMGIQQRGLQALV